MGARSAPRKYDLPFEDRDVINNAEYYQEMVTLSGQPLQPTLEIDGHILADVSGEEVEGWLIQNGYIKPSTTATDVPTNAACQEHPAPRDVTARTSFMPRSRAGGGTGGVNRDDARRCHSSGPGGPLQMPVVEPAPERTVVVDHMRPEVGHVGGR